MNKVTKKEIYTRDGGNLDEAPVAVLLGIRSKTLGLDCGNCGFKTCGALKKAKGYCAFNITDLGIALGSAVNAASLHHADNRIMYSIGMAAKNLKLMGTKTKIIYGIPLSVTGKNIFFDREKKK